MKHKILSRCIGVCNRSENKTPHRKGLILCLSVYKFVKLNNIHFAFTFSNLMLSSYKIKRLIASGYSICNCCAASDQVVSQLLLGGGTV